MRDAALALAAAVVLQLMLDVLGLSIGIDPGVAWAVGVAVSVIYFVQTAASLANERNKRG